MTRRLLKVSLRAAAFTVVCLAAARGDAAEIKVIGSTGVQGVVTESCRHFEAATGHKVLMDFQVFAGLKRRIDAGEYFDIAILSPAMTDELIKEGKIDAHSRADFGRSGMAVGVRKGAAKPDISSVEALKRTLLNAKSVAYSKEGASGAYFVALLDRLGIAEDMKAQIKPYDRGLVEAVADGEAEMVVTSVSTIMAVSGAELAGEVPTELQHYVVFAAAMSAASKESDAAKELLRFWAGPVAIPVFKAKGIQPGGS
jgi:molybdate transport system substrate-binding protein